MTALPLALAIFMSAITGSSHSPVSKNITDCLATIDRVRLPGSTTRFDYQSIDERRRLLFISHLGDNSVVVFDLDSRRVVKDIKSLPGPHGILAVPELGKVFVSATKTNLLYVMDEKSLQVVARIDAGYFPDGIAYAPGVRRIFVSDEFGKTVAVIDAASLKLISKIPIGGVVGNTHYDPISKVIVTADESANELLLIDPSTLKITSRISLSGCDGAHGFSIGVNPHLYFVSGEKNASLVVVDPKRKSVIQKFKVGNEPDVLAIDPGMKRLYVSSESGIVSIFGIGRNGLRLLCNGELWPHAHSVSVDDSTRDVYFPLQDYRGKPVLQIMRPREK